MKNKIVLYEKRNTRKCKFILEDELGNVYYTFDDFLWKEIAHTDIFYIDSHIKKAKNEFENSILENLFNNIFNFIPFNQNEELFKVNKGKNNYGYVLNSTRCK